tara:strand:- start:125 stop:268 length:144 start_codon:yes stop_codon:yes gene_type:complete
MHTLNGDIGYSVEDGYLILHTHSGDVMIGPEDLEDLLPIIQELLENE